MFRSARSHARPAGVERSWAAAAAVLDYPTAELVASLDRVEALVPGHAELVPLIEHLRTTSLRDLQEEYVATFDHTRKCALYLTYFAYGDTRRRGVALVQFKQAFRAAGVQWDEDAEELLGQRKRGGRIFTIVSAVVILVSIAVVAWVVTRPRPQPDAPPPTEATTAPPTP